MEAPGFLPKISVLLPAYNEEKFIAAAIESVLSQSFSDFELIIVNDGSNDATSSVVRSYHDSRIHLHIQENRGLARALNTAITISRGEFIARLDADDTCEIDRLRVQLEYLKMHPKCGIVGSGATYVHEATGNRWTVRMPTSDEAIRRALLWRNPFLHSTVLIRRDVFRKVGMYDPNYFFEDYELWLRVLCAYPAANIDQPLVTRTLRDESYSATEKSRHYAEKLRIIDHPAATTGNALARSAARAKCISMFLVCSLARK